jgi:hypothetical protein
VIPEVRRVIVAALVLACCSGAVAACSRANEPPPQIGARVDAVIRALLNGYCDTRMGEGGAP